MLYTMENSRLRLQVCDTGAQMVSLILLEDGREQLWQGDDRLWGERAPWLFPVIGRLKEDAYVWQGQRFSMPMHGFAMDMTFACVQHASDMLCLQLTESEASLRMYPWHFALTVQYCLVDDRVDICCTVENRDRQTMFFSLGAHPGFQSAPGDLLQMNLPQPEHVYRLNLPTHLLNLLPTNERIGEALVLNDALFDADAILLKKPGTQGVQLIRQDGSGVRFAFGSVPWLGLWSREKGHVPYVCIEPWFGVDDPLESTMRIEEKKDIQQLQPGGKFSMSLQITPFAAKQEKGTSA